MHLSSAFIASLVTVSLVTASPTRHEQFRRDLNSHTVIPEPYYETFTRAEQNNDKGILVKRSESSDQTTEGTTEGTTASTSQVKKPTVKFAPAPSIQREGDRTTAPYDPVGKNDAFGGMTKKIENGYPPLFIAKKKGFPDAPITEEPIEEESTKGT
jgi:hypothetical protein